jgi:[acyl-carrier-protein] S-malonyltransferase
MTKSAFVFPGQGSQTVGMLADLAAADGQVMATFAEASEVLSYDLWDLAQTGPAEKLDQTEFTQPALLAASTALWRVAMARGAVRPDVVAGHSLGEYSALVAAGVVSFADAIRLVSERGRFMQTAVPLGKGGMAAVLGLEDAQVREICVAISSASGVVQAVNYNAPGQVVIAGENSALQDAIDACKVAGAKRVVALSASAPFHSELMRPAADKMAAVLAGVNFSSPKIPVIQNVHADYEADADAIRENLVKQMYSAVLWTGTVERMVQDGVTRIIECGPGKVLVGLNKRISRVIDGWSVSDQASLDVTASELWL